MTSRSRYRAVLIGASLGGVEALQVVLGSLRTDLAVPVLVTQHTGPRLSTLDRLLGRVSRLPVGWAVDGDEAQPGRVHLCPPGSVLRLDPDGTVSVEPHGRPSSSTTVDEMFTAAARALGDEVLAVVLTGTGSDGTAGARAVKEAGGTVVVQDELTSLAFGMPRSVIEAGAADLVLPLTEIPELLDGVVGRGERLPLPEVLAAEAVFAAGGEMGALMAATDWARSPLGPVERWPALLRTTLAVVLAARVPMNVLWGPDMVQLYNDAARDISGTKHPEMLGRPLLVSLPEAAAHIGPPLREVWRTGQGCLIENLPLTVHREGFLEQVYATVSYSPLRDGDAVVGILATLVETTDQVRANRRLRTLQRLTAATADDPDREGLACERMAAALAENRQDVPFALLYLTDRTGTELNLAAATGLEPGSAVAPHRLTPFEGSAWPASAVLRSGEPVVVDDLATRFTAWSVAGEPVVPRRAVVLAAGRRDDGAVPAVLVLGVGPTVPFDDDLRGFLGLVAERVGAGVLAARRRRDARERMAALAALGRAKDEFFAGVSHEFRTPLTLMLLPLEQLVEAADLGTEHAAAARLAHRNALRLLKLVNALLEFTRAEQGATWARFDDTDLAALTAEVAGVFSSAVERAGLEYVVDCPPLGRTVPVDRGMWEQIVLNLVSNAFKHTFTGTITVSVRLQRNHAQLEVADTGVGIAAEEIPHVFDRFHRIRGARARSQEGAGLGLASVRQLVRLHRGSVRVRSTVGRGTRFTVWLPLVQRRQDGEAAPDDPSARRARRDAHAAEARLWLAGPAAVPAQVAEAADPDPALPGRRPTVLLVDDNRDVRDCVARLLGDRYAIVTAADGKQAVAALADRPVDLVLADVLLPELDGLELLARIRGDPRLRATPVVLLTAVAHPDAAVAGLAAGASDYIVKPFTARELVARIDAQLALADLRAHPVGGGEVPDRR
ncbi:MAG TPA: chemotaxis protein CheB [Pseudonocardia sp.]